MLFPIVHWLRSSGDVFFLLAPARAGSRDRHVLSSFSLRGVPSTTQTDKTNPENDTGDAVSSGKKVGPELTAGNASRGEPPI